MDRVSDSETLPGAKYSTSFRWISLLSVVGFLLIIGGIYVAMTYMMATHVKASVVSDHLLIEELGGPGVLDATGTITLSSRIYGRLDHVSADRNDIIRKGQVVAALESDDLSNQLAVAKATVVAAKAAIDESRGQRASANAVLVRAGAILRRRRLLALSNVSSNADLDTAEAEFAQAEGDITRLDASIIRAVAQEASAEAAEKVAAARLEDATLRTPCDAIVIERQHNVGDMIAPGVPIFKIVDVHTVIVAARLDESVMSLLDKDDYATIEFSSDARNAFAGKVLRLHKEVDRETREFTVDVELDSLPKNWALGQRAFVKLHVGSPKSRLAVLQSFLDRRNSITGLWVLENGRARWHNVQLGVIAGEWVEVLSGVKRGVTVVDPDHRFEYESIIADPAP